MFKVSCENAGGGEDWTPRDLRHTFVSPMSDDGMAIEKISRLVGNASSHVTETVYRQELRPVLQEGAEVMDRLFRGVNGDTNHSPPKKQSRGRGVAQGVLLGLRAVERLDDSGH